MAFDNMGQMMKIMGAWTKFKFNHPKFPAFLKAVQHKGIQENTVVEIIITGPEGDKLETSIKVKQSDIELFNELKSMAPNGGQ